MGILWLTVWTFDACFDRIPDRPRRVSTRAVGIMILAAMIAAGCLIGAADCWIEGVEVGSNGFDYDPMLAFCLVIAIGLVLVGAEAARTGTVTQTEIKHSDASLAIRSFVLARWSASFRLVLLLAIGPTLLALTLATAHRAPRYTPLFTKNAAGVNSVSSYVLERTDQPYAGEILLGKRLMITAILLGTIMVHGAAAVGVGLGFATVADGRGARSRRPSPSPSWWHSFCRPTYFGSATAVHPTKAAGASPWR